MPATTATPLNTSTSNSKWYFDVNTGTTLSPVWVRVNGIVNFTAPINPTMADDSDYDSGGFGADGKFGEKWAITSDLRRAPTAASPTAYDPGQEYLRIKSIGNMGPAAQVEVRYYEMAPSGPRVEAYQGKGSVSWAGVSGGAQDAPSRSSISIAGVGRLNQITHPDLAAVVATLYLAAPSTAIPAAGGKAILVKGNGFTGTVGVTVGGTAATGYTVIDDSTIVMDVPAKTAGTYPIVVTNASGASVVNVSITYV